MLKALALTGGAFFISSIDIDSLSAYVCSMTDIQAYYQIVEELSDLYNVIQEAQRFMYEQEIPINAFTFNTILGSKKFLSLVTQDGQPAYNEQLLDAYKSEYGNTPKDILQGISEEMDFFYVGINNLEHE